MNDTRRKIVHVTSKHRPFDVRIFEKQCKSLAAAGHHVVLVAAHDRNQTIEGVHVKAVPRPTSIWNRLTSTTWQVYREAIRQDADIYQIHDPELIPWAILLRMRGARVVYDMHENLPKDLLAKVWIPAPFRPVVASLARVLQRLLLPRLPVIFAEQSYQQDYPWVKQATVVQNFVKTDALAAVARQPADLPTVGYIGGVWAARGSQVTLQALRELQRRGLPVGWECVGPIAPATHDRELREYVQRHRMNRIRFHGYLPAAKGWSIISSCQVGLAVLRPDPNYVESFPTKMFEYMALSMPVVVSRFPLYRRVIDECECGVCVDPEDAMQLADAIESLICAPKRAQEMGRRGREAVLRLYDWRGEFERLTDFYDRLMQSSQNRWRRPHVRDTGPLR